MKTSYFSLSDDNSGERHCLPITQNPDKCLCGQAHDLNKECLREVLVGGDGAVEYLGFGHDVEFDPDVGDLFGFAVSEADVDDWTDLKEMWGKRLKDLGFIVGKWITFW